MSNMIKKIQENGNSLEQDVLRKRFKIPRPNKIISNTLLESFKSHH